MREKEKEAAVKEKDRERQWEEEGRLRWREEEADVEEILQSYLDFVLLL